MGTLMTFNRSYRLSALGFAVLSFSLIAAGIAEYGARAEPRPETFHPSGPALAGDQSRFDEGVRAYDAGDHSAAFDIWLPLAKAGDLAAQRNVAHLLRNGMGTEADPVRALFFYERAARSGLASAALNAGMMRLEREADYFNARKAREWLTLAATAGSPIAQWELSRLLETGEGGREDPEGARLLLQQAAEAGHEEAKARLEELMAPPVAKPEKAQPTSPLPPAPSESAPKPLGDTPEPIAATSGPAAPVSIETGAAFMEGVFQFEAGNYANAAAMWRPLAEADVIEAQYRLGRLYQFGMGVPRDTEEARQWLETAGAAGHDSARDALTTLPPSTP